MTFNGSIPNVVRAQIFTSYVEGTLQLERIATPYIKGLRRAEQNRRLRQDAEFYPRKLSGYTWQLKGALGTDSTYSTSWMLEFDTDEDAVKTLLHALESTLGEELVSDEPAVVAGRYGLAKPEPFRGHVFFERFMRLRKHHVRHQYLTEFVNMRCRQLILDIKAAHTFSFDDAAAI